MSGAQTIENGSASAVCNSPQGGSSSNGSSLNLPADLERQYLQELLAEREKTTCSGHAARLIEQEIIRVQNGGKVPVGVQSGFVDIHKGRPIRLQVKVLVPVKDHPNFNFVGKLLGPKGNSLKRLQEETQTKMAILGRGSMRDKTKEEELRQLPESKYQHLQEELHVEVTTFAPPSEAYRRMAHAIAELKPFLVPDYYDDIRQNQLRELAILNGEKRTGSQTGSPGEPTSSPQAGTSSPNGTALACFSAPATTAFAGATHCPLTTAAAALHNSALMMPGRVLNLGLRPVALTPGAAPIRLPGAQFRPFGALPRHPSLNATALPTATTDGDTFLYGDEYPTVKGISEADQLTKLASDSLARRDTEANQAEHDFFEWTKTQLQMKLKTNRPGAATIQFRPYGPIVPRF